MRFNPIKVWERLANKNDTRLTLFMGVPTIFAKMLEVLPQLPDTLKPSIAMENIRLVVSGSAALPTSIFNRWKTLTGHTILVSVSNLLAIHLYVLIPGLETQYFLIFRKGAVRDDRGKLILPCIYDC
jgi:acyl-CoA synthetase (AMP-forming)/AMP-acid ligase II